MKFVSEEHKEFFMSNSDITSRGKEYAALIYTLGINADCREHLSRLYDKESRCVNPAALCDGWQTGGSVALTRLAFHLFTGGAPGEEEKSTDYLLKNIFRHLDDFNRRGALLAIAYFA